jgi:outer membrane biosynthesis protein TonB
MKPTDIEDEDEPGFFKKNLVMIIIGGIALAGGGYMYANYKPSKATSKKKLDMVMVMPVMPPPPPPPPPPPKKEEPPPEEEKEEKMIEQAPEEIAEKPEDKPADEPKDEPLGTALTGGDGSSGLGVGGGGGGRGMIGGGGGKGGTKWGWYAGSVQSRIADALRNHPLTKRAGFTNTVKIWADSTGRINRVRLGVSTGDRSLDNAIENEVLNGLVLNEPPPDDMPMPINLRVIARKPN